MKRLIIPMILAFCIIPAIVLAATWFDNYGTTRKITLETTSGDLTNFTYVLNYSDFVDTAGFIGDGLMLADCKDIRITDDDNSTLLEYEFEDYDDSTYGCNQNNTLIWVNSPNLFANNSSVNWFYYNYPSETTFGNDTVNAWDDGYFYVNHLSLNNSSHYFDSRNNLDTGIFGQVAFWNETDGVFGNGIHVNKTYRLEYVGYNPEFDKFTDTEFTIELWFKSAVSSTGDDWILNRWGSTSAEKAFVLFFTGTNNLRFIAYNASETSIISSSLTNNVWYHIAITQNTTHLLFYLNGVLNNTTAFSSQIQNATGSGFFVASQFGTQSNTPDDAWIDEIRFNDNELSADEIKRTYENSIDQMASLGTAMSIPAVPKSTLEIWDFSNLTLWLMIFLFFIPTAIMFLKVSPV